MTKHQALEKAQHDLERRVVERTSKLSEINEELRERDRLRHQFFADIGHELRTPVTAIRGEAEVALRSKRDVEAAHQAALAKIVSLSEQLTENVSDLFLVAREQTGVLDFRTATLDLNLSTALGIEQMASLALQKDANIAANLSRETVEIEGNNTRIAQLVHLLVSNALMHAQDGVHIDVSTYVTSSFAVLEVSDNGPGIPEKERKRIFDRYVKGARDAQRSASGTVLGLAIAKSITQAHGSGVSVAESTSGGARFTARFPLMAAQ